jgi:hypothetical protein
MAIYDLKQTLRDYGQEYLILDFNHLFVAATLHEEVWLLRGQNDTAILADILDEAAQFNLTAISADRDLESYSGGEQVILACLLVLAMVRSGAYPDTKVLLINMLESLSEKNRSTMLEKFARARHRYRLRPFTRRLDQIEELTLAEPDSAHADS